MRRVLILGGTAEARELAARLARVPDVTLVSSLAGRVSQPRLPVGEVRIGGFGGVPGLVDALRAGAFTHLVDATHPFAVTMSSHAAEAASATGIPLLRLVRPGWAEHPLADTWHWVNGYDVAREAAESLGDSAFLTTGRQTLGHFAEWAHRPTLVRVVEPVPEAPPAWTVVLDRGPYSLDGELAVMRGWDVMVTKDSGGTFTSAKLDAATRLGVPVVVVSRPAPVSGAVHSCVAEVVEVLQQ